MKYLAALFLLSICIGCWPEKYPDPVPSKPKTPTVDVEKSGIKPTPEQAEEAIKFYVQYGGFKDPDSVKYRNIVVLNPNVWEKDRSAPTQYLYGWEIVFEINGKNSYGAYVGYRPRVLLRMPDGTVSWNNVINRM